MVPSGIPLKIKKKKSLSLLLDTDTHAANRRLLLPENRVGMASPPFACAVGFGFASMNTAVSSILTNMDSCTFWKTPEGPKFTIKLLENSYLTEYRWLRFWLASVPTLLDSFQRFKNRWTKKYGFFRAASLKRGINGQSFENDSFCTDSCPSFSCTTRVTNQELVASDFDS